MISLLQLQEYMQSYLMQHNDAIQSYIVGTAKVAADQRLQIYSDAYRLRLLECLQADFPALHSLLGDEQFSILVQDYIHTNPSQSPSVRWLGQNLVDFLRQQPNHFDVPYIAELAALEWTIGEVFDAADASVIAAEQLQEVAPQLWGEIQLQFHPSVRRLDLHWNVVEIREQILQQAELSQPQPNKPVVSWLFWRQQLITHYIALPVEVAWALDIARQGAPFAEVCAGLCAWMDEQQVGLYAATLLKNWLHNELIVSFTT